MPRSRKVKLFDSSKLTPEEKKFVESLKEYIEYASNNTDSEVKFLTPPRSGLFGNDGPSMGTKYHKSPNEKVIKRGDAYITLGKDKPSGNASGKSRSGALRAAKIDLVVGRMAGRANPPQGTYVGNSFEADAARIYISELTDIDKNFGVDEGKSGEMKDRSGIGIKADGVRIIGREGVKIVTGRMQGTNEKNSLGGKLLPAPTIELIAGNNSSERIQPLSLLDSGMSGYLDPLQGVARGHNTVIALQELSSLMGRALALTKRRSQADYTYGAAMDVAMKLPQPLQGVVTSLAFGIYSVSVAKTSVNLHKWFIDKVLWDINYTQPFGYRYIESRNVKST